MMKIIKSAYLYISLIIILAALVFQFINIHFIHHDTNNESSKEPYSAETFRISDNSWGYTILRGKKLIIRQDIIPAIQQSVPFQSEKDAREIAHLVVNKLNHKKLPKVAVEELDSLQIVIFQTGRQ